jgi:IMP dehydrogenase/GMP reductase
MVQQKHRVSSEQAKALGMLTSVAGLSAMQMVLMALPNGFSPQLGAASIVYWRSLLAGAAQVPSMFLNLEVVQSSKGMSATRADPVRHAGFSQERVPISRIEGPDTETLIVQLACTVLGVEAIDLDTPLVAQGLDSLAGLELRQKIEVSLSLPLHFPNMPWPRI